MEPNGAGKGNNVVVVGFLFLSAAILYGIVVIIDLGCLIWEQIKGD